MQLDPFSRTRCVDIDECSLEENVARCQGIGKICSHVWKFEINKDNVWNINLLRIICFFINQEESHVSILSVATNVSVQVGMRKIKMEVAKVIAALMAYDSFDSTDIIFYHINLT